MPSWHLVGERFSAKVPSEKIWGGTIVGGRSSLGQETVCVRPAAGAGAVPGQNEGLAQAADPAGGRV